MFAGAGEVRSLGCQIRARPRHPMCSLHALFVFPPWPGAVPARSTPPLRAGAEPTTRAGAHASSPTLRSARRGLTDRSPSRSPTSRERANLHGENRPDHVGQGVPQPLMRPPHAPGDRDREHRASSARSQAGEASQARSRPGRGRLLVWHPLRQPRQARLPRRRRHHDRERREGTVSWRNSTALNQRAAVHNQPASAGIPVGPPVMRQAAVGPGAGSVRSRTSGGSN